MLFTDVEQVVRKSSNIVIFCLLVLSSGVSYSLDKNSIDVVLVMDSTGSMKKTDPQSLRIPAAKMFISLLDKNDRAGVISFNDSAESLSPLKLLDGDSSKNNLFQAIDGITSTGLHTNLYAALQKGLEVVSAESKKGGEQVIVLMSDGLMDTGNPEKDRALIEEMKTVLAETIVDRGVKVYAIAFTGESDKELLEKVSKRTGGFFNLAMTDKDFHVVFASIFESLKKPDMLPISDNGFLTDKSVEEVTIVATKGSPGTTIQLASPAGDKYSFRSKPPDIGWFASDNFDMMTVKRPAAGRWEILFSSGKNNKAYIMTNLNLRTDFNNPYPLFGETLDLNAWLEKEGTPIKAKEILEKIEIYFELTRPDGETMRLQPLSKGDGIFAKKVELYTPGNYRLRLVADGKTFQREKVFTFKVAGAKESEEDLRTKQAQMKSEMATVQQTAEPDKKDAFSWKKVIMQFVTINLILGAIVFGYLKRGSMKKLVQSGCRRKKADG